MPQKTDKEPPLPDFIKTFAIQNNYGFNKIDILDGNIGYMNILGFSHLMKQQIKPLLRLIIYLILTHSLLICGKILEAIVRLQILS